MILLQENTNQLDVSPSDVLYFIKFKEIQDRQESMQSLFHKVDKI